MKRRIMIIGPNHSGKQQIAQYLDHQVAKRMSACLFYGPNTLTVPGAYLESPWMQSHIIAAQQDADCILMLSALTRKRRHYPPNFAHAFRVPIIGVITKSNAEIVDDRAADIVKEFVATGIPQPFVPVSLDQPEALARLERLIMKKKTRRSV